MYTENLNGRTIWETRCRWEDMDLVEIRHGMWNENVED
jgi:hypothetical protein